MQNAALGQGLRDQNSIAFKLPKVRYSKLGKYPSPDNQMCNERILSSCSLNKLEGLMEEEGKSNSVQLHLPLILSFLAYSCTNLAIWRVKEEENHIRLSLCNTDVVLIIVISFLLRGLFLILFFSLQLIRKAFPMTVSAESTRDMPWLVRIAMVKTEKKEEEEMNFKVFLINYVFSFSNNLYD